MSRLRATLLTLALAEPLLLAEQLLRADQRQAQPRPAPLPQRRPRSQTYPRRRHLLSPEHSERNLLRRQRSWSAAVSRVQKQRQRQPPKHALREFRPTWRRQPV